MNKQLGANKVKCSCKPPSVGAAASFDSMEAVAEPTGIVLAAFRRSICTCLAGQAVDCNEG